MTSRRLLPFLETLPRRARFGMVLGLDRMIDALAKLGDPHLAIPFVHIAGTNGKGSTSAMVSSILQAAGLRTGLYTSPHLCRMAERVRIDGEPVEDDMFAEALERVMLAAPENATFFEMLTLAAFVVFDLVDADVGVLEVGLGGRLDATNVVPKPLATAITSIAFDHTAILGSTLSAITREKAGIFKPGVPVVLGPLDAEAMNVALDVAQNVGASPILHVAGARDEGQIVVTGNADEIEIVLPSGRQVKSKLSLPGAHQASNAAVAVGLSEFAATAFPQVLPVMGKGLSSATWPGRLERIDRDGKLVVLDCAHNPQGAEGLVSYVRAQGWLPERVVLVFGALADKAWTTMLDIVGPLAERRVYASPKGRAPASLSEMAERFAGESVSEPRDAIHRAIAWARPGDVVLVVGSIFLVGEVRAELLGLECDPIVAL
jgi:dihydrofolate synthase / folylpolyglutamate synthase